MQSQESHPSLQSSGAIKAIPAANERTGKELLLQSTTVNQTPRAQNCTWIVTHFNQQSHIVWLQYLFKKKKLSLLNVLSQKREQGYQASIHHNRLHPFTHIDNSYLTVQTSFSLITAGFVPLNSPPSPWNLEAALCHHYRLQEKTPPSHSSTQKNLSNVKYIPLKQITGYHRFSANNVQIILRQLIVVRQTEVTCLILLSAGKRRC